MNSIWHSPSAKSNLVSGEIQVWLAEFGELSEQLTEFEQILSPDERERADRYRRHPDRVRFTVARGVLRRILAGYSGLSPSELEFSYSERGKPQLKTNLLGIEFNVSHSEELGLFAIALNRQVGVDVELIRTLEVLSLAKRFFQASEYSALGALQGNQQLRGFFQLWTAKEAYVKATGEGLSGLESVEFCLSDLKLAKTLTVRSLNSDWFVQSLDLGSEYCAAIAVAGKQCSIKCWKFNHSE
ncbi:MAG: 4'-phosphopantetheinyl transferase superfamily protein [Cyanobacteriota bacterium]|nr:4'-phosphopantetheinyl transferase superfamily protein [Cyanobacteriota bacterium]